MLYLNKKIITDGEMTGTDVLNSIPLNLQQMSRASFHLIWTGTPSGVIKLQASNDEENWTDLTDINSKINNPAGVAGDLLLDLNDLSFKSLRVQYTNASGTGVLNVVAHSKGGV